MIDVKTIMKAPKLMDTVDAISDIAVEIYEETGMKNDVETNHKTKPISISYGEYTAVLQLAEITEFPDLAELAAFIGETIPQLYHDETTRREFAENNKTKIIKVTHGDNFTAYIQIIKEKQP